MSSSSCPGITALKVSTPPRCLDLAFALFSTALCLAIFSSDGAPSGGGQSLLPAAKCLHMMFLLPAAKCLHMMFLLLKNIRHFQQRRLTPLAINVLHDVGHSPSSSFGESSFLSPRILILLPWDPVVTAGSGRAPVVLPEAGAGLFSLVATLLPRQPACWRRPRWPTSAPSPPRTSSGTPPTRAPLPARQQ